MPQGIEIYKGGSPTISVTTSLCRVLGKVDLTDSQGAGYGLMYIAYLAAVPTQLKLQLMVIRLIGYIWRMLFMEQAQTNTQRG